MTLAAAPPASSLLRDLARVVGDGAVLHDADRLLVYESDGLTRYRQAPAAVVLPRTTDECARVVALLHGAGIAVVPRGAGTGLSGGAVPVAGAVVLGTARMNRILELDPRGRRARVQPGVVNADLVAGALPHGLTYPPDPSSGSACTLGGNVAENSGGPHCLKYGVTSRYVTALTVVTAGGEVVELGDDPDGLDLVGLFVGSEGCFGLATEIELVLVPMSQAVRTLLVAFDRPEEAGAAVSTIIARGLLPAALEIVDGATIRAVEASIFAAGYPIHAGAALVVEFDGPDAGLDEELALAEAICREAGATEVRTARTTADRAALWKGRKKAFGAMGRLAPDLMVQDATVPRSRLPEVLATVGEIAARHGLAVANVFHAGDGNLHPNLLFDRRDPDQVERVEAASKEIMEACVAAGGTITGEHGVGLDKRHYMPLVHGPDELAVMAAVRDVFDPEGLWNPGKVLPDGVTAGRWERAPGGGPEGSSVAAAVAELGVEVGEGSPARALPADETEAARLFEVASQRGWRTAVRAHGRAPPDADLVVSAARFDRVIDYSPPDLTVTVGAGMALTALAEHLGAEGQWLPVDGPGIGSASVGGLVATGRARALAAAFGAVRDQVLGLRLVTADGRRLRLGGRVVKNVAGFDLVRLAVGSRGRLGLITEVTLRLHPLPAVDRTLVLDLADQAAADEALEAVRRAPFLPASVEAGGTAQGIRLLVRVAGSAGVVRHGAGLLERALGGRGEWIDEAGARESREEMRAAGEMATGGAAPDEGRAAGAAESGAAAGHRDRAATSREDGDRVRDLTARLHAVFDPAGILLGPDSSRALDDESLRG